MTGAYTAHEKRPVRLLCLGNELLGDDAVGIRVGRRAIARFGSTVEVVCSPAAGLRLLDDVLGAERLIVVDSIQTGTARPGVIHIFDAYGAVPLRAAATHGSGLFGILALAKTAGLPMPRECIVVAVETGECATIGSAMQPEVEAAIPAALDCVSSLLARAGYSL